MILRNTLCSNITDSRDIETHVVNYFQDIFGNNNICISNDLVSRTIPTMVTTEENIVLTAMPSFDDIKKAVFNMNTNGALGPDGFGVHFFQHFWDIVVADVVNSVQEFFCIGVIIPNLNSNVLVLIPKEPDCNYGGLSSYCFGQFSIQNYNEDRLAIICMCIISPQQRGFVRDRHISDCVILASEMVTLLTKKTIWRQHCY